MVASAVPSSSPASDAVAAIALEVVDADEDSILYPDNVCATGSRRCTLLVVIWSRPLPASPLDLGFFPSSPAWCPLLLPPRDPPPPSPACAPSLPRRWRSTGRVPPLSTPLRRRCCGGLLNAAASGRVLRDSPGDSIHGHVRQRPSPDPPLPAHPLVTHNGKGWPRRCWLELRLHALRSPPDVLGLDLDGVCPRQDLNGDLQVDLTSHIVCVLSDVPSSHLCDLCK